MTDRNLSDVPLRSLFNCLFNPIVVYARAIQEFLKERFFCGGSVHAFVTESHFIQTRLVCIKTRVLLEEGGMLVSEDDVGACLDLAGRRTRPTQEILGLRIMVVGQVYKWVKRREELEWIQRINIKKIRGRKVSGATPSSEVQLHALGISRQPTSDCRQFEGTPHQASSDIHRQLPT